MSYPTGERETFIYPNRSGIRVQCQGVNGSKVTYILLEEIIPVIVESFACHWKEYQGTYESTQHKKANSKGNPRYGIFFSPYDTTTDVNTMTTR